MADDLESGVDERQPAETPQHDDISSDIRAAIEQSREAPEESGSRERDASGRFVPRGAETVPPEQRRPEQAAATQAPDPNAPQDQAAKPLEPQQHWAEADKALFRELAKVPGAQQRWLDRETQFQRAAVETGQKLKAYESTMRHFEPHMEQLKRAGLTPEHYVGGWIKVEQRLMQRDPKVFVEAAQAYGFNPADVIAALGGQPGQPPAEPEYVDPKVAALEKRIAELQGAIAPRIDSVENFLTAQQRQAQETALNGLVGQITEFASAKGQDGQPLRPHYAEVEETMLILAQGEIAAGKALTVNDLNRLYETAVYANPVVRDKVLAERARADQAKRDADAKAKAAQARRAGSSISGAPSAGAVPLTPRNSNGTVADDIRAAIDQHRARA